MRPMALRKIITLPSRKLRQNRVKMGAAATVAAVLVAGLAIVRSQSQADS